MRPIDRQPLIATPPPSWVPPRAQKERPALPPSSSRWAAIARQWLRASSRPFRRRQPRWRRRCRSSSGSSRRPSDRASLGFRRSRCAAMAGADSQEHRARSPRRLDAANELAGRNGELTNSWWRSRPRATSARPDPRPLGQHARSMARPDSSPLRSPKPYAPAARPPLRLRARRRRGGFRCTEITRLAMPACGPVLLLGSLSPRANNRDGHALA